MSAVRYLCDEDVPKRLAHAVLKVEPAIDIHFVGDNHEGIPPKGTEDPALLLFAEAQGYSIVSQDKGTMPGHLANHWAQGHHTWGVFLLRPGRSISEIVESLLLIWSCAQAEDLRDIVDWLP